MVRTLDYNSEVFSNRAKEFLVKDSETEINQLIDDLIETLKANPDRLYLCANEVGEDARVAVINFSGEYKEFINPLFQHKSEMSLIRELDPSDNKEYIIPRFTNTTVCYLTKEGKEAAFKLNADASKIFGQIIDCLNGIHDKDYGLEVIPDFDSATEEEQLEVIEAYKNNLMKIKSELDTDISNDENLNKWWTSYKYNLARANGEIEVETPPVAMNRKQRRLLNKITKKLGGNKNG